MGEYLDTGQEVDIEKKWIGWREHNRKLRVKERERKTAMECEICGKVCRGKVGLMVHLRACKKKADV